MIININNLHPACSIVFGDFDAKCSKWCASDKNNTTSVELDITITFGYNQMIDKPTHYINESSSFIDLILFSNVNLTKNYGVEQSLYKKCHHNTIYGTLNFNVLVSLLILGNYGILKMQILSVFKNQLTILTEQRTMQNLIRNIFEYIL